MKHEDLRKYAELAIRVGVNLQPGQNLVIGYGIRQVLPEHIEFARVLTEVAYEAGAKFVQIDWGDEHWLRQTIQHGSLETLEARAKLQAAWVQQLADEGAAYLAIPSPDPNLYAGVDLDRVNHATRSVASVFQAFNQRRTNDDYAWTLLSAPTQAWADQVYPELPAEARIEAMWKDLLHCARATGENPVADWQAHLENLSTRSAWLNSLNIRKLHYQSEGTDLTLEFSPTHYWTSAGHDTPQGVTFVANIPTEEVYSVPLKHGVNGTVTSKMPLNHNGSIIEGIRLTFEQGRIVSYSATKGQDALTHIIESDEGSHFLGEVALVPVKSPISEMGRLFYNTLYDENASCHLAIGGAYPLLEGGRNLPRSEWEKHGLNESIMHVDFMIGSADLTITAETSTGEQVAIFKNGNWA
jgi:aminopeptidase